MKRCSQCGRTYSDDTRFCLDDGALLDLSDADTLDGSEDPTVAFYHTSETLQTHAISPKITSNYDATVPPNAISAPSKSGKGLIIAAFIGGLCLAGLAAALFVFFGRNQTANDAGNRAVVTNRNAASAVSNLKPVLQSSPKTGEPTPNLGKIQGKYPESSSRRLTEKDIEGKSVWDLRIMRNEIFARYGYRFRNPELRQYFESQPWYEARFDDVVEKMSDIEKDNAAFLLHFESK